MTDVVLDASVVLKWFRTAAERHAKQAHSVRASFEAGELFVLAPPLLNLEIVNVAGRRWGWNGAALAKLAASLEELSFQIVEPELAAVARWTGRGLTAYDAAYVAVAEGAWVKLVSDDELIVEVAPEVTVGLSEWTLAQE